MKVNHFLVLSLTCFLAAACRNKSFFAGSKKDASEGSGNAQAAAEADPGIVVEPVAGLEPGETEAVATGDVKVSLLINELNADYQADIEQEFVLSYTSQDVQNCELSFEGSALVSQEARQNLIAQAQGTYSLTCYDAEGAVHSDARSLSLNQKTQTVAGSETISSKPTDVVFAVDTSGSMSGEMEKLEQTLPAFIDQMSKEFPGDSFQMFMLSEDEFDLGDINAQDPRYHPKNLEVSSQNALEIVFNFVDLPANQCVDNQITPEGCIRKDSNKELVVISDDQSDYSMAEFLDLVNGSEFLKDKTGVNGFVGLEEDDDDDKGKGKGKEDDGCSIQEIGQTYIDLAANADTMGLVQHLCEENYTELLVKLKESIVKKSVQAEFELEYSVDPASPVTIKIDGGEALIPEKFSLNGKILSLIEGVGAEQTLEIIYTPIIQ
ncbi:MAG: vWA domain-containing protein [Oligoflexales bacterium]